MRWKKLAKIRHQSLFVRRLLFLYPSRMLLLCIGPDTFRAQEKARELESAFRQKYDPSGSSVERITPGKEAVDEIVQRANTISLFSPRRFMRTTDLLSDCAKTKQPVLVQALSRDPEHVIVVSVEGEPFSATVEKAFAGVPKIIKYEYPEQGGAVFKCWLTDTARRINVTDQRVIDQIADATDGDSWWAWNELMKVAASGQHSVTSVSPTPTIYEYAEGFLRDDSCWRKALVNLDISSQILTTFLSQARAAVRVRDNATDGLHPYVIKKMRVGKFEQGEKKIARSLIGLLSQRAGYGSEEDSGMLL